jgi:hypothetical protein
MLSAASLLLMTVAATTPSPGDARFSSYEDAACNDSTDKAPADEVASPTEVDCSLPPVPAVIDCNDERTSVWVADMIGSCDMPRPSLPGASSIRSGQPGAPRYCDGLRCTHDPMPLRAAARAVDDGASLVFTVDTLPLFLHASPLDEGAQRCPPSRVGPRLERPPRTV